MFSYWHYHLRVILFLFCELDTKTKHYGNKNLNFEYYLLIV